jgi:hypothetical protein
MLPKILKVTEIIEGMKHTIELGNAAVVFLSSFCKSSCFACEKLEKLVFHIHALETGEEVICLIEEVCHLINISSLILIAKYKPLSSLPNTVLRRTENGYFILSTKNYIS